MGRIQAPSSVTAEIQLLASTREPRRALMSRSLRWEIRSTRSYRRARLPPEKFGARILAWASPELRQMRIQAVGSFKRRN